MLNFVQSQVEQYVLRYLIVCFHSSPHQAEGRSSPCPDETHLAGVDSSAAVQSGEVSAKADCDAEGKNRKGDGLQRAQSGTTRRDGMREWTDGSRGVDTTGSNVGSDRGEFVVGQETSDITASSTALARNANSSCDADQRNVVGARNSDEDHGRVKEVDGKAKCGAATKRTAVH